MIIRMELACNIESGMTIKHNNCIIEVWGTSHYTDGTVGIHIGIHEVRFEQGDLVEVVED